MKKLVLLLITILFTRSVGMAALSPVAISLFPPVQFPPSDFQVTGLRLSPIIGRHAKVSGIDIGGIGNSTIQEFTGLAIAGGYNYNAGIANVIGLQASLGANINKGKHTITGLQLASVNYNMGSGSVNGFQVGLANLSGHSTVRGIQAGIYNRAKDVYGLQIGLVNSCENLHGIQIGLMNHYQTGTFKYVPVINMGW